MSGITINISSDDMANCGSPCCVIPIEIRVWNINHDVDDAWGIVLHDDTGNAITQFDYMGGANEDINLPILVLPGDYTIQFDFIANHHNGNLFAVQVLDQRVFTDSGFKVIEEWDDVGMANLDNAQNYTGPNGIGNRGFTVTR
jgi:hypothetical protein